MQAFADSGALTIDLVSYRRMNGPYDVIPALSKEYENGFRRGGAKITVDGSLQGWTGFLTKPYHKQRDGVDADYVGYATFDQSSLNAMTLKAYENGWPLLVHTNGDAATDMYIQAVRLAEQNYPDTEIHILLGR